MLDTILKYWATWGCGIAAAVLVLVRKKIVTWYTIRKQKKAADEFADRYVLYMKMEEIYREAKENGYITVDDIHDAEETYKHYHVMGGNGKATLMIEVLRDMEKC